MRNRVSQLPTAGKLTAIWSCSAQRMSLTSASVLARVQIESAVSAGTPSRAASARHARSASESPCVLVLGRSLAISTQSASVIGSRITASRRSSASWPGSSPAIADLESTSAQFATLMAAPSSMALRTSIAPFSSFRCAITAEVSSTAAGLLSGSASGFGTTTPAGCFCCVRPVISSRFDSAFGDHLVDQAASWGETGEHAACALDRRSASLDYELGRRLLGNFECMCHEPSLAPESGALPCAYQGGERQAGQGLKDPPPRGVLRTRAGRSEIASWSPIGKDAKMRRRSASWNRGASVLSLLEDELLR
jgi:hypothetical protein